MSKVHIFGWSTDDFEQMALKKINSRLRHAKKDMLKNFQCGAIMAETVKEAIELRDHMKSHYVVLGYVSLDDGGAGRAFKFLIEKALSWKEANDLADKLALQIDQCCDRMIADKKRGRKAA